MQLKFPGIQPCNQISQLNIWKWKRYSSKNILGTWTCHEIFSREGPLLTKMKKGCFFVTVTSYQAAILQKCNMNMNKPFAHLNPSICTYLHLVGIHVETKISIWRPLYLHRWFCTLSFFCKWGRCSGGYFFDLGGLRPTFFL